jgi:hypothetical protein
MQSASFRTGVKETVTRIEEGTRQMKGRGARPCRNASEDTVMACQGVFLSFRIVWIKALVFFHHRPRNMQ